MDRKSRSGFAIYMAGGLSGWYSKMQRVVALTTLESEYIAAATCAQGLNFFLSRQLRGPDVKEKLGNARTLPKFEDKLKKRGGLEFTLDSDLAVLRDL